MKVGSIIEIKADSFTRKREPKLLRYQVREVEHIPLAERGRYSGFQRASVSRLTVKGKKKVGITFLYKPKGVRWAEPELHKVEVDRFGRSSIHRVHGRIRSPK